jgi:hypothetical protein
MQNPVIETNFRVEDGGLGSSIQEILDSAQLQNELIFFKDIKGAVWQIIKRDESDLPLPSARKSSETEDSLVTSTALYSRETEEL